MAALGEVVVCGFEDNASVGDEDAGDLVEVADLVHAAEVEDDLVKDRHAAADQTGVAALRVDGEQVVVAVFHDLRDLLGGLGLDDQLGLAAVLLHPVGVVALQVGGGILVQAVDDGALAAQQLLEELDIVGRELFEARVALDAVGVGGVFNIFLRPVGLRLGRVVDAGR